MGRALLGPLLVAFELTAPLLLVAIIGAVTGLGTGIKTTFNTIATSL